MCLFFKKMRAKNKAKVETTKETPKEITKEKVVSETGFYEIFYEAGFFKYRLKSENDRVLIFSSGYTTRAGAISGINTLKRSIPAANFRIITDKNNFTQFRIYSENGARLIANGEYYDSVNKAKSALKTVEKIFQSKRYVDLKQLPLEEIREEVVTIKAVESNPNGLIEVYLDNDEWRACLKASNGQILFVTSGYASKANVLQAIETIKNEVKEGTFSVVKDLQDRYQYLLYSANTQQLLAGETYGTKESCLSSIESVHRFIHEARIVEL